MAFILKDYQRLVCSYGIAELELTGLYVNIHGFIHILKNRYVAILVDHRAIEDMKKAKHEPTKMTDCFIIEIPRFSIGFKIYARTQNVCK